MRERGASRSRRPWSWRAGVAALLAGALLSGPVLAGPPPPPSSRHDEGPPPPPDWVPPPPACDPGVPPGCGHVHADPPPLPVAMRVAYAPFYVAGLVVRYGVYYVLIAPFEVLFRTIGYGVEGGVEPDSDPDPG